MYSTENDGIHVKLGDRSGGVTDKDIDCLIDLRLHLDG